MDQGAVYWTDRPVICLSENPNAYLTLHEPPSYWKMSRWKRFWFWNSLSEFWNFHIIFMYYLCNKCMRICNNRIFILSSLCSPYSFNLTLSVLCHSCSIAENVAIYQTLTTCMQTRTRSQSANENNICCFSTSTLNCHWRNTQIGEKLKGKKQHILTFCVTVLEIWWGQSIWVRFMPVNPCALRGSIVFPLI